MQRFSNSTGAYVRQSSLFRDTVKPGTKFEPESNRYVLYVSYYCPWAHRTLITRKLKGLESHIRVVPIHYYCNPAAKFTEDFPDPINNAKELKDLYLKADPNYNLRYTVPLLWDCKLNTIVNNESSEIIRILNDFGDLSTGPDLYPASQRTEIDQVNEWIYDGLNNGVYKAGFATDQKVYETNARLVYDSLLRVEEILSKSSFLVGPSLTEADIRLFTTIIRFDAVYFGHFKCNLLAVKDCPNIVKWMNKILEIEGIKETVNMDHIKKHYYMSHITINPTQIVPLGPLE